MPCLGLGLRSAGLAEVPVPVSSLFDPHTPLCARYTFLSRASPPFPSPSPSTPRPARRRVVRSRSHLISGSHSHCNLFECKYHTCIHVGYSMAYMSDPSYSESTMTISQMVVVGISIRLAAPPVRVSGPPNKGATDDNNRVLYTVHSTDRGQQVLHVNTRPMDISFLSYTTDPILYLTKCLGYVSCSAVACILVAEQ